MTPNNESHPMYEESPAFGYDAPEVQDHYTGREFGQVSVYFKDSLKPGMDVLDCGCGPGTLTLGLAQAVDPGQATGIDIESGMVEKANALANERGIKNVEFRVDDITDLSFPNNSFDLVFASAVLEHLPDPVVALREVRRVLKPGGTTVIINTDWGDPLISPESDDIRRFFELFEAGFNRYGGSLNRGRHLRLMMREAGLDVTEFQAYYGSSATPETIRYTVGGYVAWMKNFRIFDEAVALGEVDRSTLDKMAENMLKWSDNPDAFVAMGRCTAIGVK